MNLHMNPVYILIIGIALSSRNTCSNLLEMGALIYQKARTIQSEYTFYVTFNRLHVIFGIDYTTFLAIPYLVILILILK